MIAIVESTTCIGGPLDGEQQSQGGSFTFDGSYLGLPTGTYRLVEGVYRWEPDEPG